jgi:phenylalanine-4-hydroxylase
LSEILGHLKTTYPTDWLLPLEMYELLYGNSNTLEQDLYTYLNSLKLMTTYHKLIADGLQLITKEETAL